MVTINIDNNDENSDWLQTMAKESQPTIQKQQLIQKIDDFLDVLAKQQQFPEQVPSELITTISAPIRRPEAPSHKEQNPIIGKQLVEKIDAFLKSFESEHGISELTKTKEDSIEKDVGVVADVSVPTFGRDKEIEKETDEFTTVGDKHNELPEYTYGTMITNMRKEIEELLDKIEDEE